MRIPRWLESRRDAELNEELEAHLRLAVQDRLERGEAPEEAVAAARREFGNVGLVREVTRDSWGWISLERLVRDVQHGCRLMARSPGFVLVAVVSLALGIGANSTMFSFFNSTLWRPLPVAAPDRLVTAYTQGADRSRYEGFSFVELDDYQRERTLEHVSLVASWNFALGVTPRETLQITGEPVSGRYFDLLAPRMRLGRGFRPEEVDAPGREPIVVIGHRLWLRAFNADPGIVGRTITLNAHAVTVVGVTGPEFRGTWSVFVAPDVWVPITMLPTLFPGFPNVLTDRSSRSFRMLARLAPGASLEQARDAMARVAARLASEYPDACRGRTVLMHRELDTRPQMEAAGASRGVAFAFLTVTALVLLNACANVASLLLARAASRRREIAMRLALGASRGQLVRQMLIESVLLALPAGVAALLVAYAASQVLRAIDFATEIPIVIETHVDGRVALVTLGLSVVAGLVFGLLPALKAARADLVPALKGAPGTDRRRRRITLHDSLVVGQVAVSLLLLVVAGLFLRNIAAVDAVNPGFTVDRRLIADCNPSMFGFETTRAAEFYRALIERVRQLPGVRSAALVGHMPLNHSHHSNEIEIEGRQTEPGQARVETTFSVVDHAYFATAGTAITRGRAFTEGDGATSPPVAIVNEAFARRYWPGESPIGRRFREATPEGRFLQVVGVAADGKYLSLFEAPQPCFFLPYAQRPVIDMMILIEHRGDEAGTAAAVRDLAASIDSAMPLFSIQTLHQYMRLPTSPVRAMAGMTTPAALVAVLLAAIGLYSVLAHAVSRRTREVGIRMAVGAGTRDVLRLVMRQSFALMTAGLAIGLSLAFATTRLLSGLMIGVSTTDGLVFGGAGALLAGVGALASLAPVRHVARIDPLNVLREE